MRNRVTNMTIDETAVMVDEYDEDDDDDDTKRS